MTTFTRWPSVDRSPTPTGWARPGNLMPAVGPSSWPRGRRATSEAEEILATAEAWWDVDRSQFRDGDRFLRNIGTAGGALDLRLGSSANANSNDPKWLGPEDRGYAYITGISGNFLSVPDEAALRITGDIDVRILLALDSWQAGTGQELLSKRGNAGNVGWMLRYNVTGGRFNFLWSANGTNEIAVDSTAGPTIGDGQPLWVRATLKVNNGASGYDVNFYTSTDGTSWTQLGSTVTGSGTTSIFASTANVRDNGSNAFKTGRVYRAQVLSGINGTTVLDVDCDAITSGAATSFTATSGQTVTINRSTSGRKSVAMPSRSKGGRPLMLLGTDDYMECQDAAQHGLLNFGGNDAFTVLMAIRPWATITNNQAILTKSASTNQGVTSPRWFYRYNTTPACAFYMDDGTTINSGSVNLTAGLVNVVAFAAGRQRTAPSVNGIVGSSTTRTAVSMLNQTSVRFGSLGNGTQYVDTEISAAAIWRRALTSREITVINNTAPWGA